MHGLKTIQQLNQLAVDNAPGRAEQLLNEADVSREGKTSPFDSEYAQAKIRQRQEKERAIANLGARTSEELISLTRGHNACPSTLEIVLANRLEEIIQANTRRSTIPPVTTEDESGVVQSHFQDPSNANQTLETLD